MTDKLNKRELALYRGFRDQGQPHELAFHNMRKVLSDESKAVQLKAALRRVIRESHLYVTGVLPAEDDELTEEIIKRTLPLATFKNAGSLVAAQKETIRCMSIVMDDIAALVDLPKNQYGDPDAVMDAIVAMKEKAGAQ